jgi:hypothetical protein
MPRLATPSPGPLAHRCRAGDLLFSNALVLVFVVFGAIGLLHHEMWRDELYPWLMARDSPSVFELFRVSQYDTHFRLWHLVLWLVTRFTRNCQAMQWIHLTLAAVAIWLLVTFSPFTRLQKALFCFGYFPFYEYCVVCRCYVLIVLLTFLFCVLFTVQKRSHVGLGAVLFLLSNVNVFGAIIAVCLAAALAAECLPPGRLKAPWETKKFDVLGGGFLFLLGLASATLQIAIRPHDSAVATGWQHSLRWMDLATSWINIWTAYVPIPWKFPFPKSFTWGSNYLTVLFPGIGPLLIALSVALVVVSFAMLWPARPALLCYLAGILFFLLFDCFVGTGALRQWGMVFVLFIVCVWLARSSHNTEPARPAQQLPKWKNPFLVTLLTLHVLAGLYAWTTDFLSPFSASKPTAKFIQDHALQNLLIVGDDQTKASTLSAYLDRQIYYADDNRFGTFSISTTAFHDLPPPEQIFKSVADLIAERHTDVLLVLTGGLAGPEHEGKRMPLFVAWLYPDGTVTFTLDPSVRSASRIIFLARSEHTVTDEMFWLYIIRQGNP